MEFDNWRNPVDHLVLLIIITYEGISAQMVIVIQLINERVILVSRCKVYILNSQWYWLICHHIILLTVYEICFIIKKLFELMVTLPRI